MKFASIALASLICAAAALAQCVPTVIDRNSTIRARIDAACPAQLFTFLAEHGDIIAATVQAAPGSTFAEPSIEVSAPNDPRASVPRIAARAVATVRWSASQNFWTIRVTGQPGEFILTTRRKPAASVRPDRHCIYELMMCNSTATWELTSEHCTFNAGGYTASFRLWGTAGDQVSVDVESPSFTPRLILSRTDSFTSMATAERHLDYRFFSTDVYDIDVTSSEPNAVGPFTLRLSCAASGCSAPAIIAINGAGRVPYQKPATLSVATVGFPAPKFEWYEATGLPEYLKMAPTLTTPRVDFPQSYSVRATNPCGEDSSGVIRVVPDVRRRVAR